MTSNGTDDPRGDFIRASFWHGSLDRANAILAVHPAIATADIHTAAILGDAAAVQRFLATNPANATAKSAPLDMDALTHLCFSTYLQRDRARSDGFVRAARALLDAGASANTGFWDNTHKPDPEWEPVLYGAAGVAHHADMTQLLLERGANPNDIEVVYHSPETTDNAALKLLVETGRITPENLSLMLVRKHDWHDYEGVKYLLEHGADANVERCPWRPLNHAIRRDNDVEIIELLLDHGVDPTLTEKGVSGVSLAARRGRRDILDAFERRGIRIELQDMERLIAACARHDDAAIREIVEREPARARELLAEGGKLLAEFAGTANTEGVRRLLDLGVPIDALYDGDPYFGIAKDSTALHVAAWRAWHATVKFLIERGAPLDAKDAGGRTPLMLAVSATVDSYWKYRRKPDSIEALLRAGASIDGVKYPSGYAEADALLRAHGARG